MDESEILQLVADGTIDMDEMDDFSNLSDEMQEKVANGELDISQAMNMDDDLKGMIEDGDIDVEDVEDTAPLSTVICTEAEPVPLFAADAFFIVFQNLFDDGNERPQHGPPRRLLALVARRGGLFKNPLDRVAMPAGLAGNLPQTEALDLTHLPDADVLFHRLHLAFPPIALTWENTPQGVFPSLADRFHAVETLSPAVTPAGTILLRDLHP